MAVHWQIPFKSLRSGTLYTVHIFDDTYSGSPVTLKGAASPFETQEDSSEDMFVPVRKQSGYIRVVDDGTFDWKAIAPATDLSRPVTLTASGAVVWQGYLQAQNFSGKLFSGVQEREFPVQCVLSVLESTYVNADQRELKNFAYIIKQAFDNISGLTINNYIFQGGESAREMLLKLTDWQNMVSIKDEVIKGKFDNFQVLTELCNFWGWTCRVCGQDVYFSCATDNTLTDVLTLTQSQLNTMAAGSSAGTVTSGFLQSMSIGNVFASTSNDEYYVRGYNKANVTGDGNSAEEVVIETYPKSVEKTMRNGGTKTEHYDDCYAIFTNDIISFETSLMKGDAVSGGAAFNLMLVKPNIGSNGAEYSVVRVSRSYDSSSPTAYATFQTMFHHSYYDTAVQNGGFDSGGFEIGGDVYKNGKRYVNCNDSGVGQAHIKIRVGVGVTRSSALWWNGSTWSSTEAVLSIRVGDQNARRSLLEINTNHAGLQGLVFVEILGSDDIEEVNGQRIFELEGLKVSFYRRTYSYLFTKSTRDSRKEYTATNTNKVRDIFDVVTMFASENNLQWGYGVVMNTDGTWMETFTYGSVAAHPEQRLVNRIASYCASSKRVINTELRADGIGAVTPRNTSAIDGTTGYIAAIGNKWRDDIVKLTLIEL